MKKLILFIAALPLMITAQNLNGRFSSTFYTFERFDTRTNSETFIRTYQGLNLNFNYSKISLRTRFNFESNIGNTLDSDARMRFYNLYLEARDLFDVATLKIGRQPLFTPVAGGLFDGVNLKLKYAGFALTGFYGGNVPAYQKLEMSNDLSNDYLLGGKLEATALEHFRFAISYIDKNFKTFSYNAERLNADLDPVTVLIAQKSNQYKYLTGEASFAMENLVDINTRYEYDLNYNATSKFEFDGRLSATEDLGVNVYYNFREPKIRYNSIFSVFNYGHTEEFEGGLDYRITQDFTAFGKYGYVKYEDENSSRMSVGINSSYGSLSYRKNLGYAGELDAFSLYAARTYLDGLLTPSLGISYTIYKLSKESEENNITSFLGGVNVRPWRYLSFDLQAQYFDNKIYQNDVRLLFKLNYLFNTNF